MRSGGSDLFGAGPVANLGKKALEKPRGLPRLESGFQSRPSHLDVPGCGQPSVPSLTSEPRWKVVVAWRSCISNQEMS